MKIKIATVCLLLLATACTSKQTQTNTTKADTAHQKTAGIQYTCTMHPNVLSNKPGTCPKCGMELVEKDNSK